MDSGSLLCCFGSFDEQTALDLYILNVLSLICLQLVAIGGLAEICLEVESVGDSVVYSNKWVLGLSFLLCALVVVVYIVHKESCILPPTTVYMFAIWSLGVVLTVVWITVLLKFRFLASLIVLLGVWIVSILVSGFIFAQPIRAYCTGIVASLAVLSAGLCSVIFLDTSIVEVSFAGVLSMLLLVYLLCRIKQLEYEGERFHIFYSATCILFRFWEVQLPTTHDPLLADDDSDV